MDHRDEVGPAGVTLLTLEFKPELFDAMDFAALNLRPIIDLSGETSRWGADGPISAHLFPYGK